MRGNSGHAKKGGEALAGAVVVEDDAPLAIVQRRVDDALAPGVLGDLCVWLTLAALAVGVIARCAWWIWKGQWG